ncbi:hypothetical protein [Pseudomonas sp. Z3-6]|uniref:hypothetical protein n=1 Tax=Pseudomonas sp. Z3-6 TaxID=2817411 RepID=UPI003DA7EE85
MEINSIDTLLDWLKVKPRTLGWGAILAYGRSETNKVLLQEYITRFGTEHYMQPITEEIRDDTTPTQKNFLHNYQMDAPRLSFMGSNLQTSAAKLTMKEVGGTHLSFTKQEGAQQWSLTRISEKNVLDGPGLKFDINLIENTGSVTSAGRVELDISKGRNYRLIDMPSEHLQTVAGERFKTRFSALPEDQKVFVLNELQFEPDQFLKPSKFVIRTHNKQGAGARLLAGEDEGEGAVLIFITMEGEANGTVPIDNADLKYLLPDGYSATVLLDSELISKLIANGIKNLSDQSRRPFRAEFRTPNGFTEMIGFGETSRSGVNIYTNDSPDATIRKVSLFKMYVHFSDFIHSHHPGTGNISIRPVLGTNKGRLEWTGTAVQALNLDAGPDVMPSDDLDSSWDCFWEFDFELSASGAVTLNFSEGSLNFGVDLGDFDHSPHFVTIFSTVKNNLIKEMEKLVLEIAGGLSFATFGINVFTLNSLLFRGTDSVKFDSVYFPGDMAVFGHVGPTQTAFSITDLEPIIPHTVPWQFITEPPRTDLTWSVRNILGEDIPKGSITNTGRYTPPTDAEMPRSSIRVVVSATDGTHTSSALVGITARSLAVNPLIMIATAGDSLAHDVSAGAVDGGALTWSIEDPSSGADVRPNPAADKDHSYVPGPKIDKSPPTVDTIVVTNPRTGLSETTSVLVLHRAPTIEVVINDAVSLPENQLQLSIMAEDGPINPGDWGEEWQVLLGSGSAQIDAARGLLTLNPAGPDKFLVITVLVPPARPGGASEDGYIVLPLPLFSVPETIRMFRADGQ